MTSKQKELNAIEQIRKIVEDVGGENSYIGMAMGLMLNIAEDNIKCDFGTCLMDNLTARAEEKVQDKIDDLKRKAQDMSDARDSITIMYNELMDKHIAMEHAMKETEEENQMLRGEITSLKAKLWDFHVALENQL